MQHWILNWPVRYAHTPEKHAKKAMDELRLQLFQAEQRVLDAQMQVDYYRARLAFFENVARLGIERVSDQRNGSRENSPQALPTGPNKLTALQ
ncbi:hypothetical protein [Burkholderia sp. L27(2015)]|uniref:hypothetical protein n=1 Tax=Burkholderia sp. L27(2015) TaxID=1641858 RepID=UPI00131CDA6F|nr:hypothetical protein [Burkholderia sp. L27(2015)]